MPDLRIASERSDEDIRRTRAEQALVAPFRILAANMLRIMRGAGKPDDLLLHMQEVINAAVEFKSASGRWPSAELISSVLVVEGEISSLTKLAAHDEESERQMQRWENSGEFERQATMDAICKSVAKLWAAKLAGPLVQKRAAENELDMAILKATELREQRRARVKAANRKPRRPTRKVKRDDSDIVI